MHEHRIMSGLYGAQKITNYGFEYVAGKKHHTILIYQKSQGKSEPTISKKVMKPSVKMNKKESKCFIIMPWLSVIFFLDNQANRVLVVSDDWTTPYFKQCNTAA